jgi:hypothetical protein
MSDKDTQDQIAKIIERMTQAEQRIVRIEERIGIVHIGPEGIPTDAPPHDNDPKHWS